MYTSVTYWMFTAMESVLITVPFILMALCWLCERKRSIAVGVWNSIVLIRHFWQVMLRGFNTTDKNEDSVEEVLKSADSSGNQTCDQTSGSLRANLVPPSFRLYLQSPQAGDNTAREIEEACMKTIIRIVNLTTKRTQPVEKALSYFQFILFDLNMGEGMCRGIFCHWSDQLKWWYSNCYSELHIIGELYGGLLVQGIRLNFRDVWKMWAGMAIELLEADDIRYVNFAKSVLKKLEKDLPPRKYSYLIQDRIDGKPRIIKRKAKPIIVLPPYAYSCEYL